MKRKIIRLVSIIVFLFSSSMIVQAETYDIGLTTNSKKQIRPGDIIEVTAGISASIAEPITYQNFYVYYDMEVFDIVWPKKSDDIYHKIRKNWQTYGGGGGLGTISGEFYTDNEEYGATIYNASDNSGDDINFDIVTYKLQVKDVKNQNTTISLVNGIGYKTELKFEVYTKSSNNDLKDISINKGEIKLTPEVSGNITKYEAIVDYSVSKVDINAITTDTASKVNGNGNYNLKVGLNEIKLEVISEDGAIKKYTLNITRKPANIDTSLSKIEVKDSNKKEIKLNYDEKKKEYKGKVTNDISFVTFNLECSGEACVASKLEPSSLKEGLNEFSFKVKSQNGEEETYKILIEKDKEKVDYLKIILIVLLIISIIGNIVLLVNLFKNKKLQNKEKVEER